MSSPKYTRDNTSRAVFIRDTDALSKIRLKESFNAQIESLRADINTLKSELSELKTRLNASK